MVGRNAFIDQAERQGEGYCTSHIASSLFVKLGRSLNVKHRQFVIQFMLHPYSVLTKEGGHEELCRIFNNMRKVCKIFCTQKMFLKYCIQADHLCFFLFFFPHPIISFDIKMETSNENLSSRGSIVGHGDQHLWLSVTSCFFGYPSSLLSGYILEHVSWLLEAFFLTSFCTWNTANTLPRTQSEHGWADADQTV